jgi:hypothetical protein
MSKRWKLEHPWCLKLPPLKQADMNKKVASLSNLLLKDATFKNNKLNEN